MGLYDRKDGTFLKKIDSMHYIMPLMYPNRCDNEAFMYEKFDLTKTYEYLEKKKDEETGYKYNVFQIIVTALLKTITLRPELNRFITNYRLYQRNEVSAAFTVKKVFSEQGEEVLAFIHSSFDDNIDSIHRKIYDQVSFLRSDHKDPSTEGMDMLQKIPEFLKNALGTGARFLDRHGWMPQSLIETDPYRASVVVANLGSIGLRAGYHHLTNWGTTSLFCLIGQIKKRPFYDEDGNAEWKMSVDVGLTVDERITDGYYCSTAIKMLKEFVENPELLEDEFSRLNRTEK